MAIRQENLRLNYSQFYQIAAGVASHGMGKCVIKYSHSLNHDHATGCDIRRCDMQTVREAIGPAEALFVLDHAERGSMTSFAAVHTHETGLSKVVRLQRGPSALRNFTHQ
jgi:hypothetical protein